MGDTNADRLSLPSNTKSTWSGPECLGLLGSGARLLFSTTFTLSRNLNSGLSPPTMPPACVVLTTRGAAVADFFRSAGGGGRGSGAPLAPSAPSLESGLAGPPPASASLESVFLIDLLIFFSAAVAPDDFMFKLDANAVARCSCASRDFSSTSSGVGSCGTGFAAAASAFAFAIRSAREIASGFMDIPMSSEDSVNRRVFASNCLDAASFAANSGLLMLLPLAAPDCVDASTLAFPPPFKGFCVGETHTSKYWGLDRRLMARRHHDNHSHRHSQVGCSRGPVHVQHWRKRRQIQSAYSYLQMHSL